MNKKVKFIALFLVLVAILIFFYPKTKSSQKERPTETSKQLSIEDGCTRTTRLENEPQYDRALSLINQRIKENEEWCDEHCDEGGWEERLRFHYFPANLTNCIKIVEKNIEGNIEGYFTSYSEQLKPNHFPIIVDERYTSTDDILTAFLLIHEITHVQQHLEFLNGVNEISCINKEVEAFISQLDFYTKLNNEEGKSVSLKIREEDDNKHSQIAVLETMIDINREFTSEQREKGYPCGNPFLKEGWECSDENLRNELFTLISRNENYQHQCELNKK